MNKILYIALFAFIFLLALVFSLQNLDSIKVYFYRGVGKELALEMPLALLLTIELLAGVVIGYSVQWLRYFKLRAENTKLKKQLAAHVESRPSN